MHKNTVVDVSAMGNALQILCPMTTGICQSAATPAKPQGENYALLPCTKPIANLPPLPPSQLDTLVKIAQYRAAHQPSQRAFTFLRDGEDDEAHLTFADLDRRARDIGAELSRQGMRGCPVLLMLDPGLDYDAALFGCLYAGAVAVPVYPPDPFRAHRTLPRLEAILHDARAALIVTSRELLAWANALARNAGNAGNAAVLAVEDVPCASDWQPVDASRGDLALLQYTSGSTGSPRGVMITHANIMHNCRSLHRIDSENVVVVSWLPPYHDMGLIGCLLLPVHSGRWVVQMPPSAFAQKPVRWLRAISKYRAKTAASPNFGYELCVRKVDPDDCKQLDLSAWTVAVSGAEPVRAETIDRFCQKFAPCGFRREAFLPAFGMAEATLLIAAKHRDELPAVDEFSVAGLAHGSAMPPRFPADSRRLVGCGRPLLESRLLIVDPHTRRPLPAGKVGEVWVQTPSAGKGYWNRPEETAAVFQTRLDGALAGSYLRTGDLGFVSHDNLFLTGRLKELIILGGKNYYPQDIEQTVETAHAALKPGGCAAFSVEHEGEERLALLAEVSRPKRENLDEILASIRRELAAAHDLVPYGIALIGNGSLPKTSSGKTRRLACKAMFLDGGMTALAKWRGGQSRCDAATADELPQSPEEEHLARLWGEVLGIATPGRKANFFELGGQSLRAAQLAARICEEFHCNIPLRSLFDNPTIAEFTAWLISHRQEISAPVNRQPPILPQMTSGPGPLSSAESRLWFLDRLQPGNPYYNMPVAARLRGPLDVDHFCRCLSLVTARHDAFRTGFVERDGRGVRVLDVEAALDITIVDLRPLAAAVREKELLSQMAAEARRPFDLAHPPLARAVLYRLADDDHAILLAMHHIIVDGFSLGILAREMGELYAVRGSHKDHDGRAAALSYADYTRWEQAQSGSPSMAADIDWWKEQLSASPPPVSPPSDRPRGPQQSFSGALRSWELSASLSAKIHAFAAAKRTTPFAVFQVALIILLARVCRTRDIAIGTIAANRPRRELESIVGFFANTLVLRTTIEDEPSFADLVDSVSRRSLDALAHQTAPFDRVVEALQPTRCSEEAPLFRTALVLENMPLALDALDGLRVDPITVDTGTSKYDFALLLSEQGDRFLGHAEYATALYAAATIDRLLQSLTILLDAAIENPQRSIWHLPLVTPLPCPLSEKGQDNSTQTKKPQTLLLHRFFLEQAERSPENTALRSADDSISYAELARRAERIARHLVARGVGPEMPVAVCLPRSAELVCAMLGVFTAGGVYIPVDPSLPESRKAFLLEDARPAAVISTRDRTDAVLQARSDVLLLEDLLDTQPGNVALPVVKPDNLAYVIYTSGSTGRPKGVMIEHRSAASFVQAFVGRLGITPQDCVLQFFPPCSDGSISDCFSALAAGATLVVPEADATRDPLRLEAIVRTENVSLATLTPSLLHALSADALPGLAVISTVGEPLDEPLARRWSVGRRLINGYGVTEASIGACLMDVAPYEEGRPAIGYPLEGVELHILDEHMEPLPFGMPGEICIGGVQVGRGYWNAPELTAQRFLPNPFDAHAGSKLYRTGDLGRQRADGALEFLGRMDDQVQVRGYRVEPGEVAATLEHHPSVARAVVVAREDRPGIERLVAYVAPRHDKCDVKQLREYLRERLPAPMLPAVFVPMDSLPQTDQGKLDRRALPAPSEVELERTTDFVAPRDPEERLIATVWEELLDVRPIGALDDFFASGGHSLLAVQVIGEIERRSGCRLPLAAMFSQATVEGLARLLRAPRDTPVSDCLVPLAVGGTGRPLFFIHPAGGTVFCYRDLARRLGAARPCYGVQAVGVDGTRPPLENIEEMALHYSSIIRQAQPDGPYFLAGWSLGGNLAFETARRLRQQGAEVAMLALLDAAALPSDKEPSLEQFLPMAMDFFPDEENLPLETLEQLSWHEQLEYFVRRAGQAELVLGGDQVESGRYVFEVFRAGMRAILAHRQQSYPGRVTLFAAQHNPRLFSAARDPLFGWGPLAQGGVEVHSVPGGHVRMVLEPHAAALAVSLAECLDRAEAQVSCA